MYSSHKQVGRSRVNKVREGLKTKKTHVQHKKNKVTGLDKLFLLQNELFKEGLNLNEYVEYLSDKVKLNFITNTLNEKKYKISYHSACQMKHGQKINKQPINLIK